MVAYSGLQFILLIGGAELPLSLTNVGINYLKNNGANAVFASTQIRNKAAQATLSKAGFRRKGLLGLLQLFGWRVIKFYSEIWYAPGEIVFIHNT